MAASTEDRTGGWQRVGGAQVGGMPLGIAALIVLLAVIATVGWSNTLHDKRLLGWHEDVIHATAPAPDQYRALTPLLVEGIFIAMDPGVQQAIPRLMLCYGIIHLAGFIVTGFFFFAFCRNWLRPAGALLCVALLMAVCAVANLPDQTQVADPLNLMFVTIGLWAIQRQALAVLFVAVIVGALNRESVLVLMGYYVLMQWPQSKRSVLLTACLLTVAWAAAYGALRLGYGMRSYYVDVVMLGYNLESVVRWAPLLLLLAPPMLAALTREPAKWPGPLRRATLVIPPYLLLHLIVARVEEVRLFLPLLPVLIPLAVLSIAADDATNESSPEGDR